MNLWSLALAALLAAISATSPASTLEDLERIGEQFDKLEDELSKVQGRMLPETAVGPPTRKLAYDYLVQCDNAVTSINREITAMTAVLNMSQFVWDPAAREMARPYIDIQVRHLVRRLNSTAEYLEKILHRSGDDQVASLCLRSRDLIRSTVPVAVGLQPAWKVP